VGVAESDVINRKAVEGSVEIRPPALERVTTANSWSQVEARHRARATYRYVTGVDNFAEILRFDERDILSNTAKWSMRW